MHALSKPLLFSAVIAFAAIHLSRTTRSNLKLTADIFHSRCVHLLISLTEEEVKSSGGVALAAVCLLRSYEILAEESDPNRHLSGAYALATSSPLEFAAPSLMRSALFNYLREDITYSLKVRQPLKMDLKSYRSSYIATSDDDELNIVTLILADTINTCFGERTESTAYIEERLHTWYRRLPSHFQPFPKATGTSRLGEFPELFTLGDSHTAVNQYHLVAQSILISTGDEATSVSCKLHELASQISGLAFTSGTSSVLVNSFGPIAFSGRFLATKSLQTELVRRLLGCRKEIGWPVHHIIADLETHWKGQ